MTTQSAKDRPSECPAAYFVTLERNVTSALIWLGLSVCEKLLGITPAAYPDGRYAYGLTIAVLMHASSVAPRIFLEAGSAQSLFKRWSRFGPAVPLVPAA